MALSKDQLSRITISGFKSIKRCDIKFRKVNVLIGSNGAGKSNFISAFTLLQNILSAKSSSLCGAKRNEFAFLQWQKGNR